MYTIRQASTMLNIPTVTIRAWEQRYNAVNPERTEGGYRHYSDRDIEDLRWLKNQMEMKDVTISQAVKSLHQLRASQSPAPGNAEADADVTGSEQELADHLYRTLLEFRTEQAKTLTDWGFKHFGFDRMIYHILVNILIKAGTEWEEGRISVANEHYMTQFVVQQIFSFFHHFPFDLQLPKAMAFCPSGERHEGGLLLFSIFLRKKGVDVLYLGPDTPNEGINEIIRQQGVGLICISLTNPDLAYQAVRQIDSIRAAHPELTFVLGGAGFRDIGEPYASWRLSSGNPEEWEIWFDAKVRNQIRPRLREASTLSREGSS